jgi:DNA-binding NarL/FixJ family response regulator
VTLRVVVVDDQELVRTGFRLILEAEDDIEVVAEAGDGAAAVRVVREAAPDVVLMDVRMPVMDGLAATEAIAGLATRTRVLMLTTFDLDAYVFGALRAGASGFLLKDTPPADLLSGIRVVARGEALLAPSVTRHLIEEFVRRPRVDRSPVPVLSGPTQRETEVLTLVARGSSNQEIGTALFVTPATAKTHVSRLLMKLGARDRAQLIVIAYETGLVRPDPRSPAPAVDP